VTDGAGAASIRVVQASISSAGATLLSAVQTGGVDGSAACAGNRPVANATNADAASRHRISSP
jgi:hypothetical protein